MSIQSPLRSKQCQYSWQLFCRKTIWKLLKNQQKIIIKFNFLSIYLFIFFFCGNMIRSHMKESKKNLLPQIVFKNEKVTVLPCSYLEALFGLCWLHCQCRYWRTLIRIRSVNCGLAEDLLLRTWWKNDECIDPSSNEIPTQLFRSSRENDEKWSPQKYGSGQTENCFLD